MCEWFKFGRRRKKMYKTKYFTVIGSNDKSVNLDDLYFYACEELGIVIYDTQQFKVIVDVVSEDNCATATYNHPTYTLTISDKAFGSHGSKFVLVHEIAHALICYYFVVLPSAKIQEILCGYVEYRLRKISNAF